MEIWKLAIILFVIILVIVIGSKVIYKNDIAIITGTIPAGSNVISISYPNGFNQNNSVCIASELQNTTGSFQNHVQEGIFDLTSMQTNAFSKEVNLRTNEIRIRYRAIYAMKNANDSGVNWLDTTSDAIASEKSFRIVLMKIQ